MQRLNLFNELNSVSAGRLFQAATTMSRSVKKCFLIPRLWLTLQFIQFIQLQRII